MTSKALLRQHKKRWIVGGIIGTLALVSFFVLAQDAEEDPLIAIRSEIIPEDGTETPYGIALSLASLPQFVEWWYTLVPSVEDDARYVDALSGLVAACCDDNLAVRCCCENDEGQACNLIRSGKGLAAHLITDLDYGTEEVQESVLQWFRFARWDYYVAAEMEAREIGPELYGLTTEGSCYRGLCTTPISVGGCGGMVELIEPAIEMDAG